MHTATSDFVRPAPPPARLPLVLVLDDDVLTRRRVARIVSPDAIARPVGTLHDAQRAMAGSRMAAVVASLDLDDGATLSWLESLRARGRAPAVLALSTAIDIAAASRASAAGIDLACKFGDEAGLQARIREIVRRARRDEDVRASWLEGLALRARLTPAEEEVLRLYVELGGQRGDLADHLGIAETSVRSRVRGVCRKLDIPHLHEVYRLLLDQAVSA